MPPTRIERVILSLHTSDTPRNYVSLLLLGYKLERGYKHTLPLGQGGQPSLYFLRREVIVDDVSSHDNNYIALEKEHAQKRLPDDQRFKLNRRSGGHMGWKSRRSDTNIQTSLFI
jgi:hypothetical protein